MVYFPVHKIEVGSFDRTLRQHLLPWKAYHTSLITVFSFAFYMAILGVFMRNFFFFILVEAFITTT